MNIKENTIEEIRKNEEIIRTLSVELDLTCEQVKDILIEDSLINLYCDLPYIDNEDDIIEYLKNKYLEE
jgi:hypothetical protein